MDRFTPSLAALKLDSSFSAAAALELGRRKANSALGKSL
jgi:hypothetical protein